MSFLGPKSGALASIDDQQKLKTENQVGTSIGQLQAEDSFSNTMLEAHRGILSKLMPSEADRKIEKFKSDLIEKQAESRLERFRQHKEFQRQALRDALDALLINGKIGLRGETAEYFTTQYRELESTLTQIVTDFLNDCEKRLEEAEATKHELIRKTKEQMINNRIQEFTEAVNLLLSRFSDIVKEGV